MSIISFICILIFLTFLLTGFRKNADFLSPGRIFGMLWSLVIALVELKLSRLQLEWRFSDWLMALIGVFTFFLGIYFSIIINLDKPFLSLAEIRNKIKSIEINENKLFKFIIVYFIFCFVSFIIEWQIRGFIPLFTSNPSRARVAFGVFILHYFVNSINVVLFLIVQYFLFIKKNVKKKIFLVIIFILSLGNFILVLHRYGFFLLIMMAFCLFYYSGRKIKFRTIVIFLFVVITLIFGIQSLRTTELIRAYIILESKIDLPSNYAELAIPYMYITMNIENFVKYYPQIHNHTYGAFTFEFLTNAFGVSNLIATYFNFDKLRLHIGGYNTFPYYWAYYYDFGVAGLFIIPMVIGFIFSEIYYYLHRHPNFVVLTLTSISFTTITISHSSDPLTRLDMMVNFIVILLAQGFIVKKSEIKNSDTTI